MKKNYLFTLAALLLGSTIANAQKPLDGYEAPSFTAPGNCGKVISLRQLVHGIQNISLPHTVIPDKTIKPGTTRDTRLGDILIVDNIQVL